MASLMGRLIKPVQPLAGMRQPDNATVGAKEKNGRNASATAAKAAGNHSYARKTLITSSKCEPFLPRATSRKGLEGGSGPFGPRLSPARPCFINHTGETVSFATPDRDFVTENSRRLDFAVFALATVAFATAATLDHTTGRVERHTINSSRSAGRSPLESLATSKH